MDLKFPARDRFNQKKEAFKTNLENELDVLNEIKMELVKKQSYELTLHYVKLEKSLKSWLKELNELEKNEL